jgi:hypothetical protein
MSVREEVNEEWKTAVALSMRIWSSAITRPNQTEVRNELIELCRQLHADYVARKYNPPFDSRYGRLMHGFIVDLFLANIQCIEAMIKNDALDLQSDRDSSPLRQ